MAILKRKTPRRLRQKIREYLWPSMGPARTIHYYRHRLFRTGDSTYKITAGLAAGAALSFTPFLGTHILQALFFSWLLRASFVAALVGTLFGNPWTFPFLFTAAYKTGIVLFSVFGAGAATGVPAELVIADADHEPLAFLSYLFAHPIRLLLPLTLGGYACAFLFWPLCYAMLYYPVRVMRRLYHERRRSGHKRKESQLL